MRILITEPNDFGKENLALLQELGQVESGPFTRTDLLNIIEDVDVLVVRLGHSIDSEVLDKAHNLKYILTPTTGLNHVDILKAEELNIRVISLKGEIDFLRTIPSTAEHTLALMLSLLRKIPAAHNHVLRGSWDRDQFKSHNLSYFKLGILGYGRVGKQMATYAKALNMPYKFYDTSAEYHHLPSCSRDLETFMKEIDILSIHIPYDRENYKFLNESNLRHLGPEAYIVNTSRGEVIDEKYLHSRLINNELSGLAVDVLDSEIDPTSRNNNPLIKAAEVHGNVIFTPHIAGATYESMWKTEEFVIKKLMSLIN